ncbi:hypothetical protein AVEN_239166-1 [Araneus ventricosus]|uniref:Uncharacterized protein n=1 Tax=Araneus ventricosus TaxID=182803 RepID=A0A4Y2HAR5_ARAVE|nr:hypothetical protein AVEN_239166-1 [Araneus ventricosus]
MMPKVKTCDRRSKVWTICCVRCMETTNRRRATLLELNVNNKLKFKAALLKDTCENSAMNMMSMRMVMSALKQFLVKAF